MSSQDNSKSQLSSEIDAKHDAVSKRDSPSVKILPKNLLKLPTSKNRRSAKVSPIEQILFSACYEGEYPTVQALIAHHCNCNIRTKTGATPLYMASEQGHVRVVKELLAAGADVNLDIKSTATPLYIASQNGHQKVVEALINGGASVNVRKKNGATPLFVASRKGHVRVIEMLICAGADVDLSTQGGQTPIIVAEKYGQQDAVQYLKEVTEAMRRAQIAQARLKEEEERREKGEYKDYMKVKRGRSADQIFNGTVAWFDASRGYGFLKLDKGRNIFVHAKEVTSVSKPLLMKGQTVNFKVAGHGDAKRATDVIPIDNVELGNIASSLVVTVKSGHGIKKVGVFSEDDPSPFCTIVPFTAFGDALDNMKKWTGVQRSTCTPEWDEDLIWDNLRNITKVEVNLFHSRKFMWDRFIGRAHIEVPFDDRVPIVTLGGKRAGELGEVHVIVETK